MIRAKPKNYTVDSFGWGFGWEKQFAYCIFDIKIYG